MRVRVFARAIGRMNHGVQKEQKRKERGLTSGHNRRFQKLVSSIELGKRCIKEMKAIERQEVTIRN